MELFGLLLAVPVTLVTSVTFCVLAFFAMQRWPTFCHIALLVAVCVVAAVAIELVLSLTVGPFHLHQRFGGAYTAWHLVAFFFGPPAIAFLVLAGMCRLARLAVVRVGVAILVCWFACMATLLGNIVIDEDIHGIDGSGQRPTDSMFPR
jgi:hypothetical protein